MMLIIDESVFLFNLANAILRHLGATKTKILLAIISNIFSYTLGITCIVPSDSVGYRKLS